MKNSTGNCETPNTKRTTVADHLQKMIESGSLSKEDFPALIRSGIDEKVIDEWTKKYDISVVSM